MTDAALTYFPPGRKRSHSALVARFDSHSIKQLLVFDSRRIQLRSATRHTHTHLRQLSRSTPTRHNHPIHRERCKTAFPSFSSSFFKLCVTTVQITGYSLHNATLANCYMSQSNCVYISLLFFFTLRVAMFVVR